MFRLAINILSSRSIIAVLQSNKKIEKKIIINTPLSREKVDEAVKDI